MFKDLGLERAIRNSGYFVASRVINKFLFMILIIFISRFLGVENLGAYGFVFAFIGIIFLFSNIGGPVFVRDIITNKKSFCKFWGNFLILKSFNSLVVYTIIILIINVLPVPKELKSLVYLTGFILFFNIFSETAQFIFTAHQKIRPAALVNIVGDLLTVSLSVFYILSDKGLPWIVISFAIGELVKAVLLNFLLIQQFSKPDLKVDLKLCTKWVKKGLYFVMQIQFMRGLFQIDILIIYLMGGLYATGLYQASYKIATNSEIIPLLFATVLYPYYINVNKTSFKHLKVYYTRCKLYIALASIALCLFLFVFSKQIIILLYGNEFLRSVLILKILAISPLFVSLSSNNTVLLNTLKKEKVCFYLSFFLFLLNFLLDIILIRPYGINGVASSTVICSVIYFVITEVYIKSLMKNNLKS